MSFAVPTAHDPVESDIRASAYAKAGRHIMPLLMTCYVVSLIDRTNIGFAQIELRKDLGFTESVYGIGIAIFFVSFILFELPSNLWLSRIGTRATFLRILVAWGAVTSLTFLISSPPTFYLSRFCLGVAEAGFFPGVLLYLTYWFPSGRRTRLIAFFLLALPISGFLGSSLAGWVMHTMAGIYGLKSWQWLFLLEGVPAVLLGLTCFFYLDDGPASARWLTEQEKAIIKNDLAADQAAKTHVVRQSLGAALCSPRVYIIGLVGAGTYVLAISQQYWLPLIISASGVKEILNVGLLSSIPPAFGLVIMLLVGKSSDQRLERRWHFAIPELVGAGAMLLLSVLYHNPYVVVALLALMTAGHFAGVTVYWSLPSIYLSERAAAGGIAVVAGIAAIGGALTPLMLGWIRARTGDLSLGLQISAALVALGSVILLVGIPARVLKERGSE